MELYQLKTFTMVAEEGHLTRAAKRLNASQPAVSAHIKALEDDLGVNLFTRTPKGMILSAEGNQLKEYADKALSVIDDMLIKASALQGAVSGDLRIGLHTEPDSLRIPELFSTLQAQQPSLQLHLLQSNSGEASEKLEIGELDAAFLYGTVNSDKIHTFELQRLKLVIAGPAKWGEKIDGATLEGLAEFPWIMTPTDCPFYTITSQLFKKHGLAPKEVANVDLESTIKTMIKAGVGLSLMLEKDVTQEADMVDFSIWDKANLSLSLSIACLKRRRDEKKIETLLSVLSRVWEIESIEE
jgi:DNA-binding transcriptional LysR family regulator